MRAGTGLAEGQRRQVPPLDNRFQVAGALVGRGLGGQYRGTHAVHAEAHGGRGTLLAERFANHGEAEGSLAKPAVFGRYGEPAKTGLLQGAQPLLRPFGVAVNPLRVRCHDIVGNIAYPLQNGIQIHGVEMCIRHPPVCWQHIDPSRLQLPCVMDCFFQVTGFRETGNAVPYQPVMFTIYSTPIRDEWIHPLALSDPGPTGADYVASVPHIIQYSYQCNRQRGYYESPWNC